jgi:hypothetical protein
MNKEFVNENAGAGEKTSIETAFSNLQADF